MCFSNDGEKLKRFRNRKRAITVWKKGNPDGKTGLVTSGQARSKNEVVWKLGAIVVPDKIRKPLKHRGTCDHGLYFYTSKPKHYNSYGSALIEVKVNPKDIIAVSGEFEDEEVICCVKAKVVKAPDPDQRKMRIKYLNQSLADAKKRIVGIEELEAAQNIKDELEQLKKQKK